MLSFKSSSLSKLLSLSSGRGERGRELKSVGFFTVDTNKLVCGVKLRMLLENTLRHAVFGQIAVYVVEAVGN